VTNTAFVKPRGREYVVACTCGRNAMEQHIMFAEINRYSR